MLDDDVDEGGGVIDEAAPEEPAEFDPQSLGPDVPSPPTPAADADDVDDEVAGLFWLLVIVFNVALLALALGPMLAYFEGNWDLGLRVFLVGVLAFAYGTFRYYRFRRGRDEQSDPDGAAPDRATTDEAATDEAATDVRERNG